MRGRELVPGMAEIGWSRTSVQSTHVEGLRSKRWEHWAVMDRETLFMLTVVDLGVVSLVVAAFCDLATGRWTEAARPLARRLLLPDRVHGADVRIEAPGVFVVLAESDEGTAIEVDVKTPLARVAASIDVVRPRAHETLNVLVPMDRNFAFTSKQSALPARGVVAGRTIAGFACLDHGRGLWPWRTRWNWCSASGASRGRVLGVNLGARWTDGSGTNENGVVVDGRLRSIETDVRFALDARTITGDDVAVTWTELARKRVHVELGVLAAHLDFRVGRFSGRIDELAFDDLLGWAESFDARW